MAKYVYSSSAWKSVKTTYVYSSSAWKEVIMEYVYSGSAWKPLITYKWVTGSWGTCSKTCGSGTQTRTVTCQNHLGTTVADSRCTTFVGTKPATSQTCNTQTCSTCTYDDNNGWLLGRSVVATYDYSTLLILIGGAIVYSATGTGDSGFTTLYAVTSAVDNMTGSGKTYTRGDLVSGSSSSPPVNWKVCYT